MFNKVFKRLMPIMALAVVAAVAAPSSALALTGSVKVSGSTTVQPAAQAVATAFMKKYPQAKVTVAGGGSGVGIKDVAAGRVNIGMSSRDKRSSDGADLVFTPMARDAMTIVIHPANPVKNLTKDQVKKIYLGQITNWKQVGGPNAAIVVAGRASNSGTYDSFKALFLDGSNQSSRVKAYASNGLVRSAVRNNQYAIGYVSMAYLNSTVKGVSIGGVAPTRTNATNGKYKYVRKLYYVTKGAPKGITKSFIDYTLSTEGQNVVAKHYLKVR